MVRFPAAVMLLILVASACSPAPRKRLDPSSGLRSDVVVESLGPLVPVTTLVIDPKPGAYAFTGVPRKMVGRAVKALNDGDPARKAAGLEEIWGFVKDEPLDREYFAMHLAGAYGKLGRPEEIDRLLVTVPMRNSLFGLDAIAAAADGYVTAGVKLPEARALIARAFAIQLGFEEGMPPAEISTQEWTEILRLSRERLLSKLGRLELRVGNVDRAVRAFEAVVALEDATFSRRELAAALERVDADRAAEEYGHALSLSDPEDKTLIEAIGRLAPAIEPTAVIKRSRDERPARRRAALLRARLKAPVPAFIVRAESGKAFDQTDFRSAQVVVVQFFSTTCGFCKGELPVFQRIRDRHPDRARLRFAVFGEKQGPERFWSYFKENPFDLELVHDETESARTAFQVQATPTVLVIGPEGRIDFRHIGYSDDFERKLVEEVEALLSTAASR